MRNLNICAQSRVPSQRHKRQQYRRWEAKQTYDHRLRKKPGNYEITHTAPKANFERARKPYAAPDPERYRGEKPSMLRDISSF